MSKKSLRFSCIIDLVTLNSQLNSCISPTLIDSLYLLIVPFLTMFNNFNQYH